MVILLALIITTLAILFIATVVLSIGGTLFTVFAADIIVAIFVIWLAYYGLSKRKKK